jgi:hypothetical protein
MEFGVGEQKIKVLFNCIGFGPRAMARSQIFPAVLLDLGWRRMPPLISALFVIWACRVLSLFAFKFVFLFRLAGVFPL